MGICCSKRANDDEPYEEHRKMESDGSTSPKPETSVDCPILSLPPDILAKIIVQLPIAQWPSLEQLDKNFRAATWIAWRQLRSVNVEQDFFFKHSWSGETTASMEAILRKLAERSPFLTSLSGIGFRLIDSNGVQQLAKFEKLQSLTMGEATLFSTLRPGGVPLETVVEFLESSRSRSSLRELKLYHVVQLEADRATILDQLASSFVSGRGENQSPLKLEKFGAMFRVDSIYIRLDTLDTTRLTDVRLGKAWIETDQLTNLIQRASSLRRIELSFLVCNDRCTNQRLQANKELLTALASHENLTAIMFDCVPRLNGRCTCMRFKSEFIEMLETIGRRGQLKKLALDEYFARWFTTTDINEICTAICNFIPHLQSIKLYVDDISPGSIFNIVNLADLEEIYFTGTWSRVEENAIKEIAQLPRLKRLYFDTFTKGNASSLKYLADSTLLTDLRIRNADWISADIFVKWSDGFASNLEILMLGKIHVQNEDGVIRLLDKAPRVRVLILKGYITGRLLFAVAQSCPELEIFGVRWDSDGPGRSKDIPVQYLQEIVDRCSKLKRLGKLREEVRDKLQIPKYRKIGDVDIRFRKHDFDDDEYN